ncbi:hypothetical protein, partial [Infirmifilum uzonense]|uniref:hypothetical protein n=1 Tax=Infirmifilum uzonense TaxID=1550241 RepID=UPI003C73DEE9
KVELKAEALAKFANLTITLVNSGGQEARDVKLLVTGDIEEKELDVGRVWHTWEGNIITKLLSPIAKVNITAVYHDLDGKRHTSTSLTTISTTNFVTPEEWRTYLIEVPEYEETKRIFVPGYRGATHLKLYLMRNDLIPPYAPGFPTGLSLIPISPNGFTLTLENANDIPEISSKVPEVRYMLVDVKPGFLCERILREDEVKRLFHINEDEKLETSKIPPGYEVKLLKEEVLNQSEIVTVNDEFYEKLKYDNWEDHDYKYEDTRVKKWDLDKATIRILHEKTMKLIYRPLTCQGDGLVKGVLVKNYAARDMTYELELLRGPMTESLPENSVLSIPAYGSVPLNLVQLKSVNSPILIHLRHGDRFVASLWVHAAGEISEFWSGFWDGVKEKLPGIIVTATIMVILAIPTHGGSFLAYVKDLLASAVIPSLMAVGVASNIRKIFEAYSAYAKISEVAEELDGFSQRVAYAGFFNTYSLLQGLKNRIEEKQGYVVESTALDLLADVTIRDVLIVFGKEDTREYEKGRALGRLVGAALSLITYAGMYYRFLSNGPKLLSCAGQVKEFLKGVYNWITPPLWDVGVVAGKLTARGIAASLAISEENDDFRRHLNLIKDDEGSLSSLVEFTGRFLDDALDISCRLGLSEDAFLGLLWAYGKCRLSEDAWDKFIQEMKSIGKKSKKCANELLHWIYNTEAVALEQVIVEIVPKLSGLSAEELEDIGKALAQVGSTFGNGLKLFNIYFMALESGQYGRSIADALLKVIAKNPYLLNDLAKTFDDGCIYIKRTPQKDYVPLPEDSGRIMGKVIYVYVLDPNTGELITEGAREVEQSQEVFAFTDSGIKGGQEVLVIIKEFTGIDFYIRFKNNIERILIVKDENIYLNGLEELGPGKIRAGTRGPYIEFSFSDLSEEGAPKYKIRVTTTGSLELVRPSGSVGAIKGFSLKSVRDVVSGKTSKLLLLEGLDGKLAGIFLISSDLCEGQWYWRLDNSEGIISFKKDQSLLKVDEFFRRILDPQTYRRLKTGLENDMVVLLAIFDTDSGGKTAAWTASSKMEFDVPEGVSSLSDLCVLWADKFEYKMESGDFTIKTELVNGEKIVHLWIKTSEGTIYRRIEESDYRFTTPTRMMTTLEMNFHNENHRLAFEISTDDQEGFIVKLIVRYVKEERVKERWSIEKIEYYRTYYFIHGEVVKGMQAEDILVVYPKDGRRKLIGLSKPAPQDLHSVAKIDTEVYATKRGGQVTGHEVRIRTSKGERAVDLTIILGGKETIWEVKTGLEDWVDEGTKVQAEKDALLLLEDKDYSAVYYRFYNEPIGRGAKEYLTLIRQVYIEYNKQYGNKLMGKVFVIIEEGDPVSPDHPSLDKYTVNLG